jgi:CDP-paratose 2-epimerase
MNGGDAAPGRISAPRPWDDRPVLITGGAGFIGTNLADRLARLGRRVVVFDNLSRPGVERNLSWLRATHGERVTAVIADIRDSAAVRETAARAGAVFHLAAQVAVTTSLIDPAVDFAVNAGGTLNLLEALRHSEEPPPLVFTSTNKVYGAIDDLPLVETNSRYELRNGAPALDERRPLDFHSPYGCSKGTADQYVLDYARSFGIPATVFRMSCIYGPHQCGTEDQGWVAHFLLRAIKGEPITIYGDGRQVRDILYIEDLLDAFLLAHEHIHRITAQPFNIGGGAENTASLREVLDRVAGLSGRAAKIAYGPWRQGDQLYYVSDHGKFSRATGWQPKVSAEEGIGRLYGWLRQHGSAGTVRGARRRRDIARGARPAEAPAERPRSAVAS